ncbi:sensor histidine kinase [Legionella nagasakiensis]|uniref:sensor histidine kinase n=1 Tax=Legionella nagasakiensis TaxID=535290 RepID=UPI001056D163|nr:HAMP domain-containing sensor histidine kinase [Legionella nagasakiensis]
MDIIKIIKYLDQSLQRHMSSSAHQLVFVGMLVFLGFPLLYVWSIWYPQLYESFELRLVGSVLGLGLMISPYWPRSARHYIHWYWFLTLLYVLPFFFTYFFLMNRASDVSSMLLLCSVFLLVLLVDLFSLCLLLVIGFGLAFLCYYFTSSEFYFTQEHAEVGVLVLFFMIAGSTVNYKTVVLQRQRMAGIAAAAGMIAHELRTPLLGITSGAQALKAFMPRLFEGYSLAKEQGLLSSPIRENRIQQLTGVSERIIREINYANTIIDMLLIKAGRDNSLQNCPMELCSMAECLHEAIDRYPFRSAQARALVSWCGDFQFIGSKLLMEHVLFNLLKNALYVIAMYERGEIVIWTENSDKFNYLYVKDTAKGMTKQQLSHLFDHFYTTTFMGTGIGLSFCKLVMNRFGGDIYCDAQEGVYTKFTLTFPIV